MNSASCLKMLPTTLRLFLLPLEIYCSLMVSVLFQRLFQAERKTLNVLCFWQENGPMLKKWRGKIPLIFQHSSTKVSLPTFKNVYGLKPILHTDGHPCLRPTYSHSSNFSVCFSPVHRGLPRSLQQQRTVHSGGQWMALHMPVRMERGRVSCGHGNTLYRWQGQ